MNREILLIEDDANYRRSIKYLLEGGPYQFVEASSPEDGIAKLIANPKLCVILLDLSFGGDPGTAVLDHLRGRSSDYRVIVLTAHDELLGAERAGEYAVFNYLPKADQSSNQAIRFSIDQAFKDIERQQLARKIRFLLDVQERINTNREMAETLDLICRSVRSTVGAYTCHIRVYDFSRGDYHLAGFAGAEQSLRHIFDRPKARGDDFSGRVVESRQAEVLKDLQNMEEFRRFAALALEGRDVSPEEECYFRTVGSAYIVPICTGLFEPGVDAVLNVSSETVAFFDAEKCAVVDEFVNQAALVITKDWLQRKRDEIHGDYSRISRMLSEMTDRLKGTQVLSGIYDVVTRRISEIVNPEVVSIFLYNEGTGLVEKVAELRGSEPAVDLNEVYEPGQSLIGAVFRSESTIQLPEPGDPRRVKPLEDLRYDHRGKGKYLSIIPSGDLKHYLAVPIKIGGKIRGVLRAMNKKSQYYEDTLAEHDHRCLLERGFSADCRNVMEITASHLAVAIRNAELLREKDRQVEQVRTLSEVGRLISSERDIEEVLDLTIRKMAEVMQAQICMLFLKEGDHRVVLRQCLGMPVIEASYTIGKGATSRVFATGKAELIVKADRDDGKYDSKVRKFLPKRYGRLGRIESLMVVPIIAKGTPLGVMKVINRAGNHLEYGPSDVEFFKTFGRYVGVAIENAQIYKLTNDRLAIAQRNAALSVLVSAVAHEINNTSGLIPANVGGIRDELGRPSEDIESMLTLIEDVANQATEFANEIAGFSVKQRGQNQALDVNEIIGSAITQLDLPKDKCRLELLRSERPLVCKMYKTPFQQIVRNIVINALEALEGRENGVLRVSISEGVAAAVGFAVVEFEDNGPGIKAKHLGRIFEPDFTTKPKGNGIGLWLVRTQLEQVGGTIDVESKPGKGAKFIVRIPVAPDRGE